MRRFYKTHILMCMSTEMNVEIDLRSKLQCAMLIFYSRFFFCAHKGLRYRLHKKKKRKEAEKSSPFYCSDRKLSDLLMYFMILFVRFIRIPTSIFEMCAEFSFQFLHFYLNFNFDTFFVDFYGMNMTSESEQKKKN